MPQPRRQQAGHGACRRRQMRQGGIRPDLRGRPPRVARRPRRLAKRPRVRIPRKRIPNAKLPHLTVEELHIWHALRDSTCPSGQATSGCKAPPAPCQEPSGSSPVTAKRNQPSLRMTDSFWCARRDLKSMCRVSMYLFCHFTAKIIQKSEKQVSFHSVHSNHSIMIWVIFMVKMKGVTHENHL